jgi:ABC-type branched-subunit amino acid transport system ATPase component
VSKKHDLERKPHFHPTAACVSAGFGGRGDAMTTLGSDSVSATQDEALLLVEHVDFSYGPLQVLFDVGIDVGPRERVGLLGTNGAGKSTLLRVVSGLVQPSRGIVRFQGEDITKLDPDKRTAMGMVQIAGGRSTFSSLSVIENIRLGGYRFQKDRARVEAGVERALDVFPQLRERLDQQAGSLSGGEQQLMALARALVADPALLIVDELSLGLAPVVMQEIMRMIDELAALGLPMLIVEQSVNVSMAIAERAYFMERGAIRFSGATSDLLERDDLVRSVFFGAADLEVLP